MKNLLTLALALGVTSLAIKAGTARANSLKNRYEANYSATWNAINDLQGQFTPSQVTFLSNLGRLGSFNSSLPLDHGAGNYWNTGERDFYNNLVNQWNNLAAALAAEGYS